MEILAARIAEDRAFLVERLGEEPPGIEKKTLPFNAKVERRFEAAGLRWQRALAWELQSNLSHMNARAVAVYVEDAPTEILPGVGNLALANEMLLRLLYKGDEILGAPRQTDIDSLANRHAESHYAAKDPREIIDYLHGRVVA